MTTTLTIKRKPGPLDQARIDDLLAKGPVRLRSPRWSNTYGFFVSLAFVGVGIWELQTNQTRLGVFTISFFGLGVLVLGLPIAFTDSLTIEPAGLVVRNAWRRWTVSWSEITPFSVTLLEGDEYVGCDFTDPAKRPTWTSDRSGLPNTWLVDDWGFEPSDFVALLNSARARWAK